MTTNLAAYDNSQFLWSGVYSMGEQWVFCSGSHSCSQRVAGVAVSPGGSAVKGSTSKVTQTVGRINFLWSESWRPGSRRRGLQGPPGVCPPVSNHFVLFFQFVFSIAMNLLRLKHFRCLSFYVFFRFWLKNSLLPSTNFFLSPDFKNTDFCPQSWPLPPSSECHISTVDATVPMYFPSTIHVCFNQNHLWH